MFGYLKPFHNELKGKHTKEYRSHYCTLCFGLRKHLGWKSSLLLNYECTFLYIFLNAIEADKSCEPVSFSCPVNPLQKHRVSISGPDLQFSSFINYHLAVLKAQDSCSDSRGLKKATALVLHRYLTSNRKYRAMLQQYGTLAQATTVCCTQLYRMEQNGDADFDSCAQCMGTLLREIMSAYLIQHPLPCENTVLDFAEHLGMWIYLIDAYDDFEKDRKRKSFNPLQSFAPDSDASSTSLCLRSGEMMLSMMTTNLTELLQEIPLHRHRELIENIIHYGTRHAVMHCKKKKEKKYHDCHCKK